MSINRDDLKSEYLTTERNSSSDFVILADASKVEKEKVDDSGKKKVYTQHQFLIECNKEQLKFRVFTSQYRTMVKKVDEALGKPVDSLVGTHWRQVHKFIDNKDVYELDYIAGGKGKD